MCYYKSAVTSSQIFSQSRTAWNRATISASVGKEVAIKNVAVKKNRHIFYAISGITKHNEQLVIEKINYTESTNKQNRRGTVTKVWTTTQYKFPTENLYSVCVVNQTLNGYYAEFEPQRNTNFLRKICILFALWAKLCKVSSKDQRKRNAQLL